MNDDPKAKAFAYRQRAEEVRNVAEVVRGAAAKKILLQVAADYEKLALQQEAIVEAQETMKAAGRRV